ncbi:nuclear transport factor 2 family protein [Mycobacterium sp.]|uniref:nuclear transport factor 2 family protein n=1 Tax=Mycobacterium sp. TaxID=1785 RepID=UPI003F94E209
MAATIEYPLATVGRFTQAIVAERFDDARALLDHDFVVYEAGGLPYSGEYRGSEGFFELFGKMNQVMELTPGEAVQYLLAEDTVAIRGRLKFTSRASGRSVEMSLVEIYTVREGLIVELDVYYKDPSAVAALLAAER